jgi:hypothetical protein
MAITEQTINVQLGAFAPSLKSQLKVFDFIPDEEIKFLQKLSDSITLLAIHGLIPESQRVKSYKKLIKKMHKTIGKYSKCQTSDSLPTDLQSF